MSEDGGIPNDSQQSHSPSPSRRSITRTRKLTFATLIVAAFLGMLEIAGRAFVPMEGNQRWRYESNHVRLTGFPALNELLEPDARRFWKLKANVPPRQIIGRVGEDNLIFTISTDGDGFRRMATPASSRRVILFVGDSCTLGIGVNDEATIPAIVQSELPDARCINAGVPGYTAYQGRVYLESLIDNLKPRVVVICFGFNDDAPWDDKSDLEHAAQIASPPAWRDQLGVTRLVGRWITASTATTRPAAGSRPRLTDAEFAEQIECMIAACRKNAAQPILLVWPLRQQLTHDGRTGKQMALIRIGESNGVPVLNLVDTVRARGRSADALFADLLHFNERGCEMAGKMIADAITNARAPADSPK